MSLMRMSEAINTCQNKVEKILEKYPVTRDSDKLLWLSYLVLHHDLKLSMGEQAYAVFKKILLNEKTPTMESVTRARRKIQESGLYQGEKRQERLEESETVKEMMR